MFSKNESRADQANRRNRAVLLEAGGWHFAFGVDAPECHRLTSDMTTLRQFMRRFPHFKRQAEAGKTVLLRDRYGKRFAFLKQKPASLLGAGKDLKGKPLSSDPLPREEFKGNY